MKKIKSLLIASAMIGLSACGNYNGGLTSSNDSSADPAADPRDSVFALTLNMPLPSDSVVTGNPTHGTCILSNSFDQITYTLTDPSYIGTDACVITDSSCSYGFGIDLSQNQPQLIAGSTNCSSN